jgi:hypothetical protein
MRFDDCLKLPQSLNKGSGERVNVVFGEAQAIIGEISYFYATYQASFSRNAQGACHSTLEHHARLQDRFGDTVLHIDTSEGSTVLCAGPQRSGRR